MNKKLVSTIIYITAVLLVLFFLQKTFLDIWQEIRFHPFTFNYWYLTISIILGMLALLQSFYLWEGLLHSLGSKLSISKNGSLKIFSTAILARYVPGKIWEFASRTLLAYKLKVPPTTTMVSMAYEMAFLTLSGLIILIIFIEIPLYLLILLMIVTGVIMFLFFTPYLHQLGIWLLKKMRLIKEPNETVRPNPTRFIIQSLLLLITFGLGFSFFTLSLFSEIALSPFILFKLTAIFAVSLSLGALVFISPAGLGAREGLLVLLLQAIFPLPTAIFISLVARIWATIIEILFLGVASVFVYLNEIHPNDRQ